MTLILNFLIILNTPQAFAQADMCRSPLTSLQAALKCAESRSPDVVRAQLALDRAKTQVGAAEQWRNPELSFERVSGADNRAETDLNLGIPIELGGKVSARRSAAESDVARAEAALATARAEGRASTLLKLHRMRQINHELEVIDEAIETFSKLVKQYAQRFKLSPEQEISVTVFKMSKSDYELRRAELVAEQNGLEAFFQTALGLGLNDIKAAIPPSPKSWPAIAVSADINLSPKIRVSAAEISKAKAELTVANSEAWPTLTVGPSVKIQNESGRSDHLYGFNLSLPLPIFNANGKGKAAAASGVSSAEEAHKIVQDESAKLRQGLIKTYQESVKVLNSSISHEDIEKKHDSIEKLFFRGVVPSSLVIEAHRTYVDLEKSRNERELKTIEALIAISVLDGTTVEAIP